MRPFLVLALMTGGFLFATAQAAHAANPALTVRDVTVAENVGSRRAVVTLRLDRAASRRTPVRWATGNGTAKAGKDYVAASGTAVFTAGQRVRTISIALRNDGLDEAAERLWVTFASTRARVPDRMAAVRITDDDPVPTVRAGAVRVVEGGPGTQRSAVVPLRLSRASGRSVRVTWAVAHDTARAGIDVRGAGTATIPAGKVVVNVTAKVIGDAVAEGDEVASVTLSKPINARIGTRGRVAIDDDDDPATSTDLQVQLAASRAVSKTFSAVADDGATLLGGTLQTTAPDGTLYRLTVPDGALLAATTITMTPWLDVEGISVSGGRLAGVDLKPSGTEFLLPALLEIIPPAAAGKAIETASFSYAGNGKQAHRFPLNRDMTKLAMDVLHFSGVGTYFGDNISIPVEPAPPSDPAQSLAAEIQHILGEERARQLRGEEPNPEVWKQIEALMGSFYTHVVFPLLAGIRSDCDLAKANNATVLGWVRQVQLLFGDTALAAEQANALDAVGDGAENCLAEAIKPCVDKSDAKQMTDIFARWRIVLLLGRTVPDPDPLDPSRECKDLLVGTITVTYDKVLQVNGFRTEESYTLTLTPRLHDKGTGYLYDDGRGGWSLTGGQTLYDQRSGAVCTTKHEYVYGGSGTNYEGAHHPQLDSQIDQGRGKIELEGFHRSFDFSTPPTVRAEVVGTSNRTFYQAENGACTSRKDDAAKWLSLPTCPLPSGGVVGGIATDSTKGRGVSFACTKNIDNSADGDIDTVKVQVNGSLWPVRG